MAEAFKMIDPAMAYTLLIYVMVPRNIRDILFAAW
jgi:hypothetical protein